MPDLPSRADRPGRGAARPARLAEHLQPAPVFRQYDSHRPGQHRRRARARARPCCGFSGTTRAPGDDDRLQSALLLRLDPRRGRRASRSPRRARNLACRGAEPIAVTDCLNFGNPEKPEVSGSCPRRSTGWREACRALGRPDRRAATSASTTRPTASPSSPRRSSGMVGLIEDRSTIVSSGLRAGRRRRAAARAGGPSSGCSRVPGIVMGLPGWRRLPARSRPGAALAAAGRARSSAAGCSRPTTARRAGWPWRSPNLHRRWLRLRRSAGRVATLRGGRAATVQARASRMVLEEGSRGMHPVARPSDAATPARSSVARGSARRWRRRRARSWDAEHRCWTAGSALAATVWTLARRCDLEGAVPGTWRSSG